MLSKDIALIDPHTRKLWKFPPKSPFNFQSLFNFKGGALGVGLLFGLSGASRGAFLSGCIRGFKDLASCAFENLYSLKMVNSIKIIWFNCLDLNLYKLGLLDLHCSCLFN